MIETLIRLFHGKTTAQKVEAFHFMKMACYKDCQSHPTCLTCRGCEGEFDPSKHAKYFPVKKD